MQFVLVRTDRLKLELTSRCIRPIDSLCSPFFYLFLSYLISISMFIFRWRCYCCHCILLMYRPHSSPLIRMKSSFWSSCMGVCVCDWFFCGTSIKGNKPLIAIQSACSAFTILMMMFVAAAVACRCANIYRKCAFNYLVIIERVANGGRAGRERAKCASWKCIKILKWLFVSSTSVAVAKFHIAVCIHLKTVRKQLTTYFIAFCISLFFFKKKESFFSRLFFSLSRCHWFQNLMAVNLNGMPFAWAQDTKLYQWTHENQFNRSDWSNPQHTSLYLQTFESVLWPPKLFAGTDLNQKSRFKHERDMKYPRIYCNYYWMYVCLYKPNDILKFIFKYKRFVNIFLFAMQ